MKTEEITKALHQKFVTEGARLVFWHDTPGEFEEYVRADLFGGLPAELSDVTVLDLVKVGGLKTKLTLEVEDTQGKYLVYSQGEPPHAEEDWLLDIRLYSAEFHADVASLWRQELGIRSVHLRDHLKARAAFLGRQERREKLKAFITPEDDEASIDMKMMAVLADSRLASPFSVLSALCHSHLVDGEFSLTDELEGLATFQKMGLEPHFWALMKSEFGYEAETPSLVQLLRCLLVSELTQQLGTSVTAFRSLELGRGGQRNAVVFLTQWRDSRDKAASYDAVATAIGRELNIADVLGDQAFDALRHVTTFWEAERPVASALKQRLLETRESVDVESIAEVANARKAGHWLAGPGAQQKDREALRDAYDAIVAAAELFALHTAHRHRLTFESASDLMQAYRDTLYQFDQQYRWFCTKAKPARDQGWDLLKTLADEVEAVYDHGFLEPLGVEWSRLLDAGFLSEWSLDEFPPQQKFFANQIARHLDVSDRKRAFVIISDAFRYEAAQELTDALNGRDRMVAELSPMLGVLPSYTTLGMASLLPHDTLSYHESGDVLVNGKTAASTDARHKLLEAEQGMACLGKELVVMKTDDARAFTKDQRVVYVYHNVVDARGDTASTEGETFDAVKTCIAELGDLVRVCINKLNAAKVWVTADHGFLYREGSLDETNKSKLSHKPTGAAITKKRYVIGQALGPVREAHHGRTKTTAGTDDETEFWVPRGTNRFHFAGGARFVHGGAMPQEVMVPVVTVARVRGRRISESIVKKVGVQLISSKHRITTPAHRFEVIQTEAVGDRRKALTLSAAVFEGEQPVTSMDTVTLDSTSDSLEDRKQSIRLTLGAGTFDKRTEYRLVLRDVETGAEVLSVPVVINRSFVDDF